MEAQPAAQPVDRESAEAYARWFRALGDPTRIEILNLLARNRGPMSVGEVVEAVQVGQSTVSHHLKVLRDVGFINLKRVAASSFYQVNERCFMRFPTAVDLVMGRLPRRSADDVLSSAPLLAGEPREERSRG